MLFFNRRASGSESGRNSGRGSGSGLYELFDCVIKNIHIYQKTLDLYVCFFNSTIFYYFNHIKVIRNTNKSGGAAHVKMTRKVNLISRTHHKRKKKGVDESVRND